MVPASHTAYRECLRGHQSRGSLCYGYRLAAPGERGGGLQLRDPEQNRRSGPLALAQCPFADAGSVDLAIPPGKRFCYVSYCLFIRRSRVRPPTGKRDHGHVTVRNGVTCGSAWGCGTKQSLTPHAPPSGHAFRPRVFRRRREGYVFPVKVLRISRISCPISRQYPQLSARAPFSATPDPRAADQTRGGDPRDGRTSRPHLRWPRCARLPETQR